ncbi:hypothetical protein [Mycoplasma marinum]|uniref:Uncharacterized protein n=1 Tax=Mycoplasma marinum TaxID=1937190 RepID=A0A4R0XQ68_9MOLU|nr:hypothetical protein [Mycoplasma marinum]TCG11715.1 hypothetical protein C4B24_01005 [Mycoplasma marinum]
MDKIQKNIAKVEMTMGKRFLAGLINLVLAFTIVFPILNLYFMLTRNWTIGSKLMGYSFKIREDQKIVYILLATISVAFFFPIILILNLVFLSQGSKLMTEKFSNVKFIKAI